tara:strand:- start:393 stop:746 length:354 start_codon:yes stop_codon:yes gene_type:complete
MSDDDQAGIGQSLLLARGLEEAFIGIGRRCGQEDIAVYDVKKAIAILVKEGITEDEAREYLEFNSIGAWVGQSTPLWLEPMTLPQLYDWDEGRFLFSELSEKEDADAQGWEKEVPIH